MFCSDWISTNKAHCCYNEHKRVPKCRKNSARNEWGEWDWRHTETDIISSKVLSPPSIISHSSSHLPRDIEEGKRFNIWVSLLVRIVNLVLLDGRIHVTHKSGFVWTMDKKFWMERAGNEGKFAFVTLLCLSCSQYWATELSSRLSYPPPRPPHTEHNSVWLHKIVIIRLSVHFFGHANPQFSWCVT